jgi:hypothetical protein
MAAAAWSRSGWVGSITWFRENLRRLRPAYRKIDPAERLNWERTTAGFG